MPGGWVAQVDQASGQTYYLNEQTGETQWEPPQPAAATLSDLQQAVGAATGQALWRLAPYSGVCGFSGVSGFAAEAKYGNPSCRFYRLPSVNVARRPAGSRCKRVLCDCRQVRRVRAGVRGLGRDGPPVSAAVQASDTCCFSHASPQRGGNKPRHALM